LTGIKVHKTSFNEDAEIENLTKHADFKTFLSRKRICLAFTGIALFGFNFKIIYEFIVYILQSSTS